MANVVAVARILLFVVCGTNLIVCILWHESDCLYSVARIFFAANRPVSKFPPNRCQLWGAHWSVGVSHVCRQISAFVFRIPFKPFVFTVSVPSSARIVAGTISAVPLKGRHKCRTNTTPVPSTIAPSIIPAKCKGKCRDLCYNPDKDQCPCQRQCQDQCQYHNCVAILCALTPIFKVWMRNTRIFFYNHNDSKTTNISVWNYTNAFKSRKV